MVTSSIKKIKSAISHLSGTVSSTIRSDPATTKHALLLGKIAARQIHSISAVDRLTDVEFSVFSQWGDDGIIEWLVSKSTDMPTSFIEFGVENYQESNTRFLIQNRNWRGLVIDGSKSNIETIKNNEISWRYDLTATQAFITKDNINGLITDAGFSGEVGILSIDVDGNDYWIWDAIDKISPHLVIVEYNAIFGDIRALTIPYRKDFVRTKSHFSNLYFGASAKALTLVGERKGYTLLGSNLNGNNLFFIRNDKANNILKKIKDTYPCMSRFREARDLQGKLTLARRNSVLETIGEMSVLDIETGNECVIKSLGNLFSDKWK